MKILDGCQPDSRLRYAASYDKGVRVCVCVCVKTDALACRTERRKVKFETFVED